MLGGNLIDRYAGVNIGTGGFSNTDTGQKGAICAGVIAGAIWARRGVGMIEAAEHLKVLAQFFQRLHGATKLEIRTAGC